MIRRNIEKALGAALADTRVVLLNGARQTGKSTLALQIVERMNATRAVIPITDYLADGNIVISRGFLSGIVYKC